MNTFYLDCILENKTDNISKVIAILKARGILIWEGKTHGQIFISENSGEEDVAYLAEAFEKYHLGSFIHDHYVTREKRPHPEYGQCTWIINHPAKFFIREDASVEDAIRFFHQEGRISFPVVWMKRPWAYFSYREMQDQIPARYLEAYVAYYVKAISACGVYACFSCDGNHRSPFSRRARLNPNFGEVVVQSDTPSNIWHNFIWENIVQPVFGPVPFIEKGITIRDPYVTYPLIYNIADYLYQHRIEIRELKAQTVATIHEKKFRKGKSYEEIQEFYISECERVLSTSSSPLLHPEKTAK